MKWISVDDRLPAFKTEVLVFTEIEDWYLAALKPDGTWVETTLGNQIGNVTHWMELPPKP